MGAAIRRLKSRCVWTQEIENALDCAQVVLALLSDGSFTSDTCRAEQGLVARPSRWLTIMRLTASLRAKLRSTTGFAAAHVRLRDGNRVAGYYALASGAISSGGADP